MTLCPDTGKTSYSTAGEARAALGNARQRPRFEGNRRHLARDKAGVYECPRCGCWHIGRKRNWRLK